MILVIVSSTGYLRNRKKTNGYQWKRTSKRKNFASENNVCWPMKRNVSQKTKHANQHLLQVFLLVKLLLHIAEDHQGKHLTPWLFRWMIALCWRKLVSQEVMVIINWQNLQYWMS